MSVQIFSRMGAQLSAQIIAQTIAQTLGIATILIFGLSQVPSSSAQTNERTREISRAGEMFTLRYEPGTKKITLGVVGSPEAMIKWDKTELEVFSKFGKAIGSHRVRKDSGSFTILDQPNPKSELSIHIQSDGKDETITIPAQQ